MKFRVIGGMLILLAFCMMSCTSEADLGIIGGADGPTAIIIGKSGEENMTYYDAIPSLEGVPTPPGEFDTGWEYAEMNSINIRMKNVTLHDFQTYTQETLPDMGYPAMESDVQSDAETQQYAQHTGDKYLLQLVYDSATSELLVTAIEQP